MNTMQGVWVVYAQNWITEVLWSEQCHDYIFVQNDFYGGIGVFRLEEEKNEI